MNERKIKANDLIHIREAAGYMGLSESALSTLVSLGSVPYVKMGRMILFSKDLFDQWMREKVTMPMPDRKN